ncbi:putative lipoprotein [Limihaloglobus sulfuriphilus]|uniref:Penicillin-binding protein activator LpoB n=1 Tax=Limihaloglobus sulfuriphilus TaxID=1851148 RepID=A0A1Q2MD84_9BACT|nr:penicillin-binding protein activator LpoB [Limihaloglobus sulfuriphilus]AQQ70651.1 putative lipoprotein [Limihaloglobus sulfuriphilus]
MRSILLAIAVGLIALSGCTTKTTNIDTSNDEGRPVMGLDYRDFDRASAELIESMVSSGVLNKPEGGRYVVATGRVVNDTMQRIDTDQLMAKVEEELMNTGKVVLTSALGGSGAKDDMVYQTRELRDNEEFDTETIAGKGQLIAPELSLSGKIIQKDVKIDKNETQVEYYFQILLTDISSGLRFWQNEVVLGKRGDRKSVSW